MHQGRCALPADEAGRVLDRLAGLEKIIRPEDIQQALAATGRVNSRQCMLTHEIMLWVVLAMGLFTEVPIRQVFKLARRLRLWGRLAPSFQPLRRTSAVGRGTRATSLRAYRSSAGSPRDTRSVLSWLASDGHRRHHPRCPRLGCQRGRLRPPLCREAWRRSFPKFASSVWSSWVPTSKLPWSSGAVVAANTRWSRVCSLT